MPLAHPKSHPVGKVSASHVHMEDVGHLKVLVELRAARSVSPVTLAVRERQSFMDPSCFHSLPGLPGTSQPVVYLVVIGLLSLEFLCFFLSPAVTCFLVLY